MSNVVVESEWYSTYFNQPLLDLGVHERSDFAGVLSPSGEIGKPRKGVNSLFLENAEAYYTKYQGFDYWRMLLLDAVKRVGANDPKVIVEYGCGFGNATLPVLDIFPNAKVVALDISPNLLSILDRLLVARKLKDRCVAVAMDAHRPYIAERSADLVFGAAILHHLEEPGPFINTALRVLKPGGSAFFFEPLEGGLAILRLICEEVVREARRRKVWNHAIYLTQRFGDDMRPQIFRQAVRGWRNRDDKWAFPRSVLDEIAQNAGAEVRVYGLHDNVGQFRRHFSYMLETYGNMKPKDFPEWGWAIFDRFDNRTFSPEMLRDLAIEGTIIFRKLS